MKKALIKFSVCTFIVAVALSSCKKKDKSSTKDKIVGSWQEHQVIYDDNENNKNDDEIITIDSFQFVLNFKSDGSGSFSQAGVYSGSFTWSVNGNYIATTDSGSTEPVGLLIVSGPSSTMTLQDTSSHPTAWIVLNKK